MKPRILESKESLNPSRARAYARATAHFQPSATVLRAVKDARLRLPPLRGGYAIPDRPCAPQPREGVGTKDAPTDQPKRLRRGSNKGQLREERCIRECFSRKAETRI